MTTNSKRPRISNPATWHPSITAERVMEACDRRQTTLENPGFCLACGEDADSCEPDARNYTCEHCGQRQVFGSEELLMVTAISLA